MRAVGNMYCTLYGSPPAGGYTSSSTPIENLSTCIGNPLHARLGGRAVLQDLALALVVGEGDDVLERALDRRHAAVVVAELLRALDRA